MPDIFNALLLYERHFGSCRLRSSAVDGTCFHFSCRTCVAECFSRSFVVHVSELVHPVHPNACGTARLQERNATGPVFSNAKHLPRCVAFFFCGRIFWFVFSIPFFGGFRTKAWRGVEEASLTAEFRRLSVRGSPTLVRSVEEKDNNIALYAMCFSPTCWFEDPSCSRS